jgi:hypothetical protein
MEPCAVLFKCQAIRALILKQSKTILAVAGMGAGAVDIREGHSHCNIRGPGLRLGAQVHHELLRNQAREAECSEDLPRIGLP